MPEPRPARDRDRLIVLAFSAGVATLTAARLVGLQASVTDLYFDEAQYWAWAQAPAWGYFSKPPMVAWLIALAQPMCGTGEACVRAPSTLIWAVIPVVVFGIGATLGGSRIGLWAGLGALLAPGAAFSARVMSTDPPLLLFWSVALLAFVRLRAGGSGRWAVMLALAVGLGLLSKYAMGYFLGCLVVAAIVDPGSRRALTRPVVWIALAAGLAMLIPNLSWNLGHGLVTLRHTGDNIGGGSEGLTLGQSLAEGTEFVVAEFGLAGPVVFALVIAAGTRWHRLTPDQRLMLAFSAPVFTVVTGVAFLNGANANWAAPGLIAAFVLAALILADRAGRAWLTGGLTIGAVFQAVFLFGDANAGRIQVAGRNPYEPLLGWSDLGQAIAGTAAVQDAGVVVAETRRDVANLIYATRKSDLDVRAWPSPAAERPQDHFQMTRALTGREDGPILAVAPCADPDRYRLAFHSVTALGPVSIPVGQGGRRTVHLFRLETPTGVMAAPAPCSTREGAKPLPTAQFPA